MKILCPLVGVNFRPAETKEIVRNLEVGETGFYLEREPDNEYDSNAIRVILADGDVFLGYIPKDSNVELAELMDAEDVETEIEVLSFLAPLKPHLQVIVSEDRDEGDASEDED